MVNMDMKDNQENTGENKQKETAKIIILSLLWVVLLIVSFLTYYAIPAIIFATWMIAAWMIKAFKGDKGGGSGYDQEF